MRRRRDEHRTPGPSRRSSRAVEPPSIPPSPIEPPEARRAIEDEGCGRPIEPPQAAPTEDGGEIDADELLRPFDPPIIEGEESEEFAPTPVDAPVAPVHGQVLRRQDLEIPTVRILSTAEIFAPLPPTPWLVRELQLAPGRPALLYGSAGAGKTIIAQSLALAIAAGVPVWGAFPTRPGRVLHVDFDQGEHPTRKRYKRLAEGHGIDLDALGDRLSLMPFPPVPLNSPQAERFYLQHCKGVSFCVIDALRGALPNSDENDSRVGAHLALCPRVSAATGTTFMIVHHLGKSKEEAGDTVQTPRGSSALLAASGVALLVTGAGDTPKRVRVVRNSESYDGDPVADFALRFEDGAESDGVRSLRVAYQGATPDSIEPAREDAILTFVREHPGASKTAIRDAVKGNAQNTLQRIEALVARGALRAECAPRNGMRLFLASSGDEPDEPP